MSQPVPEPPSAIEPLPPATRCHALVRQMLLIRRFEERAAELYQQGKIRGFLHLCNGQEAVAVGVAEAIGPDDRVVAAYREHGHALARGVPVAAIMAEMFGKATGCSRGRGGSMHLFDVAHGLYGGNAIVAGGLPWPVASRSPTGRSTAPASRPVSSATVPSRRGSSTSRSTSRRSGIFPCCSSARTTATPWGRPSNATSR